jgi:hypothetical protein
MRTSLRALVLLLATATPAASIGIAQPERGKMMPGMIHYESAKVDGLTIFYREAGSPNAQTILLLHGLPSSSRMFDPQLLRLSDKYHLVAPDYPGFGHSDAPDPAHFAYTFDHLASVINRVVEVKGIRRYTLYLQDYGGPVGFRLALLPIATALRASSSRMQSHMRIGWGRYGLQKEHSGQIEKHTKPRCARTSSLSRRPGNVISVPIPTLRAMILTSGRMSTPFEPTGGGANSE